MPGRTGSDNDGRSYIVVVECVDSLYRATNGSSGTREAVGFNGSDPSMLTEIILNAATDSLTNIDITVPDSTGTSAADAM